MSISPRALFPQCLRSEVSHILHSAFDFARPKKVGKRGENSLCDLYVKLYTDFRLIPALTKTVTVVRSEDDKGRIVKTKAGEFLHHLADLFVHMGHACRVRPPHLTGWGW